MKGFNVGSIMSMKDMEIAKDYLNNKEADEKEVEQVIKKTSSNLVNKSEKREVSLADLGKDVVFDRIRRVTGYLTGNILGWNKGKRQELADRKINEVNH